MLFLNKQLLQITDIKTAANFGGQDIFLLVPFLSEELYYNTLVPEIGTHNESLYTKWLFTGKNIVREANLQDCDYTIAPFKFNIKDQRIKNICQAAKNCNKQVISFYTDDSSEIYNLPENLILFRTSLEKQALNNRVMPALHPDHFSGFTEYQNVIGFCGQITSLRQQIIQNILQTNIKTDFIFRQGFWAPEVGSKVKARKQYYTNLLNNKYALCIRGSGNFSFRFYEALCFGRIPILIDTDTTLPFSNIIDWNKHIIFIKQDEIKNLPELLEQDKRCMHENRKLWEEYFSIEGYARNFTKDI